jgi:hypothetical protein
MRVPPAVKAATPFDSESPRGGLVGLLGLFRSPARGWLRPVSYTSPGPKIRSFVYLVNSAATLKSAYFRTGTSAPGGSRPPLGR